MPAGRPPKPTALKVLHGDRKDRINLDEPKPRAADSLEPPRKLSRRGKALWRRLAQDMSRKGVVTDWDLETLQAYCQAFDFAEQAAEDVNANGMRVTTPVKELADGTVVYDLKKNPAFTAWREATMTMVSLAAQLGLTPAARTKLGSAKEAESAKKGADLLSS